MNTEEYNIKIKELRKERDFHRREANRLDEEMDKLVNSIDKDKVDWMLDKYIQLDRRPSGGYLEFFHVDKIESRPRGYTLYGKGFDISMSLINVSNTCTLFIEDGNLNCITEITREDFYKAFDKYIEIIRNELSNVKNYKSLGDMFEFKNALISAKLEMNNENSISNKVLATLKTE